MGALLGVGDEGWVGVGVGRVWGVGWSFCETWVGGGDDSGGGGGDGGGWLVFGVMHGAIIVTEEGIICCRLE